MFQSYALFPHMTVADNVALRPGDARGAVGRAAQARRDTLELVHLGPMAAATRASSRAVSASAWRWRARWSIQPPVLLLDEPMGALDAKLREEMQIELRALQHRVGITTIMVTHDQAEAMTLADRVVLMNKGRIEQVGRPFEMYEQPERPLLVHLPRQGERVRGDARRTPWSSACRVTACPRGEGESPPARSTTSCGPRSSSSPPRERAGRAAASSARVFLGNHWLFQVETPLGIDAAHARQHRFAAGGRG